MSCTRCGGCVVAESFYDCTDESYDQRTPYQRCLNCGAIEDALIRANRVQGPQLCRPTRNPIPQRLSWDPVGVPEKTEGHRTLDCRT